MAITVPSSVSEGTCRRAGRARFHGRRSALAAAATAIVSASLVSPALAQKWRAEAGVESQLTWSSNPDLGVGGGRDDVILDVRPHIRLSGEGARLRVSGSAALTGVTYVNHTQPSHLLPQVDLTGRLEAVERLLFLEAGVRAQQTSADPFGPRPEAATTRNTLTTTQARLSPYIEANAGIDMRYRLRSDNTWTRESGADATSSPSGAGYFGRQSALLEHDPRPFGWRVEAERSETRFRDGLQESLVVDLARASIDYAVGADLTVGLRAGRERTSDIAEVDAGAIYGVQAHWQPSPRTTLSFFDEKRFFGSSWRLAFDHRTPRLAWNVAMSRTLDTSPQALLDLPAGANLSNLLNDLFSGRFPDPNERARVVDEFIRQQGLPSQTLIPTTLFSRRLSIVTERRASVALIGPRNSLALSGFQARTEDATETGPLATGSPLNNNVQHGASLVFSHRLTPLLSGNVSVEWSRIRALGAAPDRSTQKTARLRFDMQVGPKTNTFFGSRYSDLDSTVATQGREGAVFAGLDHRF